jgi:hypothetical protein
MILTPLFFQSTASVLDINVLLHWRRLPLAKAKMITADRTTEEILRWPESLMMGRQAKPAS